MKHYRSYMDRQELPAEVHENLLNLNVPHRAPRKSWAKYGALAACAALILGVGVWKPAPGGPAADSLPSGSPAPAPVQSEGALQTDDTLNTADPHGFVVSGPEAPGKLAFPMVPAINYPDITDRPETAASRAYAPGTFTADLKMEDIQTIFWGPEGRPAAEHPKLEQGDLPWMLFWDGYTVHGMAWYDGQGRLTELSIFGEKGRAGFTLELRLGALPFTCCVDMNRGDTISRFNGVEIAGWSKAYDRDGDGQTDQICGSEFMTENGIGVRFVNVNSAMRAEYGGSGDMDMGGARTFNALFVRQALTGGLHLDHLMAAESVPAWRDVTFDTLAQARQETGFAPYLPQAEPEGYGEFFGRLSYQEGHENMLFVRWTRGYDNVEVDVFLPEGDSPGRCDTVDIGVPESYDTRLYEIPWCDSVPEEYRVDFSSPTFRAEDMSLDTVMAREVPHDTGGVSFHFNVLHENGVLVRYDCDGMTAGQVWELVEPTLG